MKLAGAAAALLHALYVNSTILLPNGLLDRRIARGVLGEPFPAFLRLPAIRSRVGKTCEGSRERRSVLQDNQPPFASPL